MKMIETPYDWQIKAVRDLATCKRGLIKTPPGAGKTLVAVLAIQRMLDLTTTGEVIVLVPTTELKTQWYNAINEKIFPPENRSRIVIETFSMVGRFLKQYPNAEMKKFMMAVIDEAHKTHSPVFSNIYKLNAEYWLGLSATPSDECYRKFGKVLVDLSWEDAKLSNFTIHFIEVDLNDKEKSDYDRFTELIKNGYREKYRDEKKLLFLSLRRRDIVHRVKNKLDCAINLIMQNKDKRMMVFGERINQIEKIASVLDEKKMPYAILHSNREERFDDYKDKKINILLSSRMLREGFNDPSAEIGIVISFPLTRTTHVQTIGRLVRYMDGKNAKIYYIIANDTTDEKMILDAQRTYGKERVVIDLPLTTTITTTITDDIWG